MEQITKWLYGALVIIEYASLFHTAPAPHFARPRAPTHVIDIEFDVKPLGYLMEYTWSLGSDFVKQ